jgi:hypothetical protein
VTVPRLDLYALGLSKEHWAIGATGHIAVRGAKVDNLVGTIDLPRLRIQRDTSTLVIENLNVVTTVADSVRTLLIDSDVLSGKIVGNFRFDELPVTFADYFERNFPSFADKFDVHPRRIDSLLVNGFYTTKPHPIVPQNIDCKLTVRDTKNAFDLIRQGTTIAQQRLRNIKLNLSFDSRTDLLEGRANTTEPDSLTIGDVSLHDIDVNLYRKDGGKLAEMDVDVRQIRIGKNTYIPPIKLNANIEKDKLNFSVYAPQAVNNPSIHISNLEARGALTLSKDYFNVHFDTATFITYSQLWRVPANNYISFKGDTIKTDNFRIESGAQQIALKASGGKGLFLVIKNVKAGWISQEVVKAAGLDFNGLITGVVGVNDFRRKADFYARLKIDSLMLNGLQAGGLQIHADADSLNGTITVRKETILRYEGRELGIKGKYFANNTLDLTAQTDSLSLTIAQRFLPHDISDLKGLAKANLHITGNVKKPNIAGTIDLTDVAVKINYLQNRITCPKAHAIVNDNLFDVTGTKIYDKDLNMATLTGGVAHNHFADFGPKIDIRANRFTLINTKQGENPIFYGLGMGNNILIAISGTFDHTDMLVQATTDRDTKITFPLRGSKDASAVNFIKFKDVSSPADNFVNNRKRNAQKAHDPNPKGLNLLLKLDVTPLANFELLFDETSGEKMRSSGNGQIALSLTRVGDFTMTGKYEIVSGDYLFTYQTIFNKPFVVKRGGTISWEGSPYDAVLNLTAQYKDLRVSPLPLMEEYLNSRDVLEASKSTEVALNMLLTGSLLHPDIAFKIEMPNINQSLRAAWQTKQRLLEGDPNEMNRQVFGLMVVRSFLPTQGGLAIGSPLTTGLNTVTEVISNQLSNYVNDMLSEVVRSNGVISGINFGINYKMYDLTDNTTTTGGTTATPTTTTKNEVQLGLKNSLFNNRLLVDIGGNIDINRQSAAEQSGAYLAGNFAIEYLITADGRFKVRAYARPETTITATTATRYGAGMSYRRDFDNFSEFLEGFKKAVKNGD